MCGIPDMSDGKAKRGDTNTDIRDDKVQETGDFRRISNVYCRQLNGLKIRRCPGTRMTKLTAASTGTLAAIVALRTRALRADQSPSKTPATAQSSSPKPAMAVAHKTATQPPAAPLPRRRRISPSSTASAATARRARPAACRSSPSIPTHADQNAEVAEKIIRKLRLGMMPPPGVRRPDAAVLLAVRHVARERSRRGGGAASQSGTPAVPAAEPRRVRARGPRPARSRRRRQRVPAARHAERRLRQHRRRADVLGDADGRLPARGGADLDAGGRRSQREPVGVHRQGAAHRVADAARRRHAVGHARRRRARLHVPGRRRLHVPHHAARHADRPAVRQRREPQRADRPVDQRRARRAARRRLEDDRDRQERSEPGHAADPRQGGPAAHRRRVHPEVRRRRRRPGLADRLHAGRHRVRRQRRHHDPAARARLQHHRAVTR